MLEMLSYPKDNLVLFRVSYTPVSFSDKAWPSTAPFARPLLSYQTCVPALQRVQCGGVTGVG